ncbi:MAG: FG-GAP repeat protein, partial [Planctomycetaceae bacterium]|nr:FG-GAP repeat protein [Planctomycetaceae bacterium]
QDYDDEDGVLSPRELQATIGTNPAITLLVTNTTGQAATLAGWIDYNADGQFDNSTERVLATVNDGTTNGRVTLTFPEVPFGISGRTYARFRLSTDAAGQNSTGLAPDGEVEDYQFFITAPAAIPAYVKNQVKISDGLSGLSAGAIDGGDAFGTSVAVIGDINADGIPDIAVGAIYDENTGNDEGAVYVLLMNANGTVQSKVKLTDDMNGLASGLLDDYDAFGASVAGIGDFNSDGVPDLLVGASADENAHNDEGAVYVVFLNNDGTANGFSKISDGLGGLTGGTLDAYDYFGTSVAGLGDIDGDGVTDFAVGARRDGGSDSSEGAVYILLMNSDATVRSHVKITDGLGGMTNGNLESGDEFGRSVANVGDINGDGIADLAVGAELDETSPYAEGAVYILLLNSDGTVQGQTKLANNSGGLPAGLLESYDMFGSSVAALGDIDGDGIPDIAVGARQDENSDFSEGAVYVLRMNADGTVKSHTKLSDGLQGITANTLDADDQFGVSLAGIGDLNGDGMADLIVGAPNDENGESGEGAVYVLNLDSPLDYGDAPDSGAGTATADYETLLTANGPRHYVTPTIFLGNRIDGDSGTVQTVSALGDDISGDFGDDEDGILDPLELHATIGSIPTVTLLVTNRTGSTATLSGWIDYNNDGLFDDAKERAQASVSNNTVDGRTTLTFPTVPFGFAGDTYARFRLSTDAAASTSTGLATNGEVEDYRFTIALPGNAELAVSDSTKIASGLNGGPMLPDLARFGGSVTTIGDLNGDGMTDLAVGAPTDSTDDIKSGSTFILFLDSDGSVASSVRIGSGVNGGPSLAAGALFGTSVSSPGDVDGDGIIDLAVGAAGEAVGGTDRGGVYILLMNSNGTVRASTHLAHSLNGAPALSDGDRFGSAVAAIGDLNGDGVVDLVVGAAGDDQGGTERGAVHVLLLNTDGTVQSSTKIADQIVGGPTLASYDHFGASIASVGDIDGDGVVDIAIGAPGDDTGAADSNRGAVHILRMNANGTVKAAAKIASGTGGGPVLEDASEFGSAVSSPGDLNGDGIRDLIVGAPGADSEAGAVWIMLLNASGAVVASNQIGDQISGGPTLISGDLFGASVAALGDVDGDGVPDFTAGAPGDRTGGATADRGAVHLLTIAPPVDYGDAPDATGAVSQGDFATTLTSAGPSHNVVADLYLGNWIDGDDGTLQNSLANADDTGGALPDDEDGVLSRLDLQNTFGSAPKITLAVVNHTGADATLSGWIDYNRDGNFSNSTERVQATVNSSSSVQYLTLTFPTVTVNSVGATIARFRLSSDSAASNATGHASDGEVEDYPFEMNVPAKPTIEAKGLAKIASGTSGAPTLADGNQFGYSVTSIGDFNHDGVPDLAVGAPEDAGGGSARGAIYVLLMNADGTVSSSTKIGSSLNGGPGLGNASRFGSSVAAIGDLDGDGITDLVVGARESSLGRTFAGAIYVLFMNSNGTVKSFSRIGHNTGGGPSLDVSDRFGTAVTAIGDVNGDGIVDIAVGAGGGDGPLPDSEAGAVYVLLMKTNGTARSYFEITDSTEVPLPEWSQLGRSLAPLGDLNGDGIPDLAATTIQNAPGEVFSGSVRILFLDSDGTVKSSQKIARNTGGLSGIPTDSFFGTSVTAIGDVDGDGIADIAVGAYGQGNTGAVYVLSLNTDGTVKSENQISNSLGGGPALNTNDSFGSGVAFVGDIDGDGTPDVAVGASGDDTGGNARGAVHLLFLQSVLRRPTLNSPVTVTENARPTFSWDAVDGATEYQVWIANQSTGANPFVQATVASPTFTPDADLPIGRYNLW